MKNSPEEIRSQLAQGNPLPLLKWGQHYFDGANSKASTKCAEYRRIWINRIRIENLVGKADSFEARPKWQQDLLERTRVSEEIWDFIKVLLYWLQRHEDYNNGKPIEA